MNKTDCIKVTLIDINIINTYIFLISIIKSIKQKYKKSGGIASHKYIQTTMRAALLLVGLSLAAIAGTNK